MGHPSLMTSQDADRLYEAVVKPLEPTYWGEYVGVSIDGQSVRAATLVEAVRQATARFGKGKSVVFHIGDRVVGRVR